MRRYNYQNKWKQLLTPEIVLLLTEIHEFKGKYNSYKFYSENKQKNRMGNKKK